MSNELQFAYGLHSTTVTAEIADADGRVWNGTAFVARTTLTLATWQACLIAVAEVLDAAATGTGNYLGDGPTGIDWTAAYAITYYDDASPAYDGAVGAQEWNGMLSASLDGVLGTPLPAESTAGNDAASLGKSLDVAVGELPAMAGLPPQTVVNIETDTTIETVPPRQSPPRGSRLVFNESETLPGAIATGVTIESDAHHHHHHGAS